VTTIAYDATSRILASDSKATEGDYEFPVRKIWRLSDGRLFGGAGDGGAAELVSRWIDSGMAPADKPTLSGLAGQPPCFTGILIEPSGRIYHFDEYLEPIEVLRSYHAIGTGARLAAKFMESGKSAKEALTIICSLDLDPDSGGGLQLLELERRAGGEAMNGRQKH
jgi:hypothetical protein